MIKFLRYTLPLVPLSVGLWAIIYFIREVNRHGGVTTIGQFLLVAAILIFFAGVAITAAYTLWEEAIIHQGDE